MKTKFTKGEWFASYHELIAMPSQIKIAKFCAVDMTDDNEGMKANIKLCAAAPDLLEALESFVNDHELGYSIMTDHMIKKAKAAIAKALE